ncbi:MAG: hypothetical protein K0S61_2969 [Anaerocolumna sp.]|jgi:ABC-type xylose transport system permease subunit|nr:hypothetical protein [Anaerocolumna sp.]
MDKIKQFFSKFKRNKRIKHSKPIKKHSIKPTFLADILTIIAMIIIFFTTAMLNKYIAMYLLAIILIIFSYFISRMGGEKD